MKNDSANTIELFRNLLAVFMVVLLLPTAAYITLTQMDTLTNYKFTHQNICWVYWPQQDLVQEEGFSHANTTKDWLAKYRAGVGIYLMLKAVRQFSKIQNHFLLGLHDLVQSKHNEIKKISIVLLGMGLLLLLARVFLSIGFKHIIFSMGCLQSSLASWFLSQPQIIPIREYWNMIPCDSLWFRIVTLAIGSAIVAFLGYTLYAIITRSIIPSFVQRIKNIYKPRQDDDSKRQQLDVNHLRIKKDKFNLKKLIEKYNQKSMYVIGIWKSHQNKNSFNIIKRGTKRPALINASDLEEHMLIVGGTGSGKTFVTILGLIYQSILLNKPVIVCSWKHDPSFIKTLDSLCQQSSIDFSLISMKVGCQADQAGNYTWSSLSYNPLKNGDSFQIRDRIMTGFSLDHDGPANFYSIRAREALKYVLDLFSAKSMTPTFYRLWRALSCDPLMKSILPRWDSKFASDCAGLISKLSDLGSFGVFNVPDSDIDILSASYKPGVLYLDFDSLSFPQYGPEIGRMFVSDLLWTSSSRSSDFHQFMVVMDEYQQAVCKSFSQLVTLVRNGGLQMVLANQTLSQLATTDVGGKTFLEIILADTSYKVFFRLMSPNDALIASQISGTETYKIYENYVEPGAVGNSILASKEMLGGRTRVDYKPLIPENVWLNLPKGVAGAIFKGQLPGLISVDHIMSYDEFKATAKSAPPVMNGTIFDGSDPEMDNLLAEFNYDADGPELLG